MEAEKNGQRDRKKREGQRERERERAKSKGICIALRWSVGSAGMGLADAAVGGHQGLMPQGIGRTGFRYGNHKV